MTEPKKTSTVDESRRRLLKSTALVGGALAAGRLSYSRPELQTFLGGGPAYAQTTPNFIIHCTGDATAGLGEGTVCNDQSIINISVSVSPIPPEGTQVTCDPSTNDPHNPTGPPAVGMTDDAGNTPIIGLGLALGFGGGPIEPGSVLVLTFKFINTDEFGHNIC